MIARQRAARSDQAPSRGRALRSVCRASTVSISSADLLRPDAEPPAVVLLVHQAQLESGVAVAFQASPLAHAAADAQPPRGYVPQLGPGLGRAARDLGEVEVMGGQQVDDARARIVPDRQVQQRQHGPDPLEAVERLPRRGVVGDAVGGEDLPDPGQVGVEGSRHDPGVPEIEAVLLHESEYLLGHGEDLVPRTGATENLAAGRRAGPGTRLGEATSLDGGRGSFTVGRHVPFRGSPPEAASRAVVQQVHHFVGPGQGPQVTVEEVLGEGPVRVSLGERVEEGHGKVGGNAPEEIQLRLGQLVEAVVADALELPEPAREGRLGRGLAVEVLVVPGLPFGEAVRHLPVQPEEIVQRVAVPAREMSFAHRLQRRLGIHHGVLEIAQALPQRGAAPVVVGDAREPPPGGEHAFQRLLHEGLVAERWLARSVRLVKQGQGKLGKGEDPEVQEVEAAFMRQQGLHAPAQGLRGHDEQQRGQRVLLPPRPDFLRQGVLQLGVIGTQNDLHGAATNASFDSASLRSGRHLKHLW